MTMDILWAISHAQSAIPSGPLPGHLFPGAAAAAGTFAVPMPPYADGSWDMYQDFVGGVQFWGYGLVSGSGDGAVRMWDSECRLSSLELFLFTIGFALQCGLAKRIGPCSDTVDQ